MPIPITIATHGLTANFYDDIVLSDSSSQEIVKISWNSLLNSNVNSFEIYLQDCDDGNCLVGQYDNVSTNNDSQVFIDDDEQVFYHRANSFENCEINSYYIVSLSKACHDDFETDFIKSYSDVASALINKDISNTWVNDDNTYELNSDGDSILLTQKQLSATEGVYEDRIQLSWDNNNNQFIRSFEIYKRVFNPFNPQAFVAIDEVSNAIHHYIDTDVKTEVIYEYKVSAIIPVCDDFGEDVYSYFDSRTVKGFSVAYTDIYGRVTFEESTPVEDVEVFTIPTYTANNFSLSFDPSYEFSYKDLYEEDSDTLENFSLMAWIKPNFNGDFINTLLRPEIDDVNDELGCSNDLYQYYSGNNSIINPECQNSEVYNKFHLFVNIYPEDSSIHLGVKDNPMFLTYDNIEINNLSQGWNQVTLTYDGDSEIIKIYINGELDKSYGYIDYSSLSRFIMHDYYGLADEVSFWNITLDSSFIAKNYNKYLNSFQSGLISYYHFDEGFGSTVYDYSKSSGNDMGLLNGHHIDLFDSLKVPLVDIFNSDFPTQVSYSALTDSNGYYSVNELRTPNFVQYVGSHGFEITPTKEAVLSDDGQTIIEPPHDFNPTSIQTAVQPDEVGYVSSMNFTDESSFTLSGQVFFIDPNSEQIPVYSPLIEGMDTVWYLNSSMISTEIQKTYKNNGSVVSFPNTNVGVEGVAILIDNEFQFDSNGDTIVTSSTGGFEISVPIGRHQISVFKHGHTFVEDIWVDSNHSILDTDSSRLYVYNFTQNYTSTIKFFDKTKRTLVGRVCGGVTEASKPYNGTSKNNIGTATFTIADSDDYHSIVVTTNDSTGEFIVDLLPLAYNIRNQPAFEFEITNNQAAEDFFNGGTTPYLSTVPSIDLRGNISTVSDETFLIKNVIDGDTTILYEPYHFAQNFVYRTDPSIDVYSNIYYEDTIYHQVLGETFWQTSDSNSFSLITFDSLDNTKYRFNKPIFLKDNSYKLTTLVSENYYNDEDLYIDTITSGTVSFNDGYYTNVFNLDSLNDGIPFNPSDVNTSLNQIDTSFSFTKSFSITYSSLDSTQSASFDTTYYGFGVDPDEGLTFFTTGPEVVEMVLRDPPGDASYSYINEGSVQTNSVTVSDQWDAFVKIGGKYEYGFESDFVVPYVGNVIQYEYNEEYNVAIESIVSNLNTSISSDEYSTNLNYSTNEEEYNIGSGGDLYITKSFNLLYGTNKNLQIINTSECSETGVVCLGEENKEDPADTSTFQGSSLYESYTIGYNTGLTIDPVGFHTKSVYDQNHIVNLVIPKLERLRDLIMASDPYQHIDPTCYNNELHEDYLMNDSIADNGDTLFANPYPCYIYDKDLDNSDPFQTSINVFENIDVEDYILDDFVDDVKEVLSLVAADGTFTYFTSDDYEKLEDIVAAAEIGSSALTTAINAMDDSFWDDWSDYLGGINFTNELQSFINFATNLYSTLSDEFDAQFNTLETHLKNLTNTPHYDKVQFYTQQIDLWKEAVRKNEIDKASIFDDSNTATSFNSSNGGTYGPDQNYSLSGGNIIEESYINSSEDIDEHEITYSIAGEVAKSVGVEFNGNGIELTTPYSLTYIFDEINTESESNYIEYGYVLADNDESDFLSIDVKKSNNGWGPIFRKRGGETMCPHEPAEPFLFYDHDSDANLFSESTQPREVPEIDIFPKLMTGVPEEDVAEFTLMLYNNSAAAQDQVFTLMIDEASNPYGAILEIDGQNVMREIMVPYNQTIQKTLTVKKGPSWLNYTQTDSTDNQLGIILRSSCQYNYSTSNTPDIADTIYFGVSFVPGCTDISIDSPIENWIYNSTNGNSPLLFELSDYNWNYYSLQEVIVQFKKSNQNNYQSIATLLKDPADSTLNDNAVFELDDSGNTSFDWSDFADKSDGSYDIRAYSECGNAQIFSEVHTGVKDVKKPEKFGNPEPSDGILSSEDNIQVNWSEYIDEVDYYQNINSNTSLSGIFNQSEVNDNAYIFFEDSSKVVIPNGVNLQNTSFTIEMRINPSSQGKIFEQGYDNNSLSLSINSDGSLIFDYNNTSISSEDKLTFDGTWQHIALTYDYDIGEFTWVIRGVESNTGYAFINYTGEGPITIGESNFVGGIHNLRIWSSNLNWSKIYQNRNITLSGRESGLIGYWPMNELHGAPQDKSRYRHMSGDFNWSVANKGHGYDFSNDTSYLLTDAIPFYYDALDDFTIEFWFKSTEVNECILSTGSYNIESLSGDRDAWSICLDEGGHVSVEHNINGDSTSTILLNSIDSFHDALWHHLALVKDAKSNTTLYLDQIEQATCNSELTRGLQPSKFYFGAKLYVNEIYQDESSHYFNGKIDEIRLWNLKRTVDQLSRYQNIRLDGDEIGLELYYPFEEYSSSLSIVKTIDDVTSTNLESDWSGSNLEENYEDEDLPIINLNNPYQKLLSNQFSYVVNQDKIILDLDEDDSDIERFEGVIIDASIEGVNDLYGNPSDAITWSFYVDRNQLIWHQENLEIEKVLGGPYVFETSIINHGGSIESFEISNLPSWLTVSPSSGLLDPNSSTDIQFSIDESLFIGDYDCQIELIGNNEFAEILNLKVNVEALQPEFSLSSQNFEYTMNFIGKVLVDDIRSRDELDVLIAYVDNEVRGYASPTYIEEYDAYIIFLTVYSDQATGDTINFRVWDASEGKIQSEVIVSSDYINNTTDLLFLDGNVEGDFNNLVSFATNNILRQEIPLQQGWNWISLNLESDDNQPNGQVLIPTVTQNIDNSAVGIIRGLEEFYQYYVENGNGVYLGSGDGSLDLGKMYRVNINQLDTIIYDGNPVDLSNSLYNIDIVSGWNWIGYLGQRPLEINEALSSINPSTGDVIKSKNAFSMYASESLGWLGTLNLLSEGNGYMLNSSEDHVLIYPESSLYGSNNLRLATNQPSNLFWQVNQNKYENSMSIIARIDNPKFYYPSSENTLGAFNGIECTGSVNLTPFENDNSLYFLTVFGNNQDNISFKYYDIEEDITYRVNNTLKFVKNNVIGSIDDPYLIEINTDILSQNESFNLQIFPNPISQEFEIEFFIEESSEVEINISDVTGRKIKTLINETFNGGVQKIKTNSSELSAGVYILDCKIGEIKCQYKLVKN